MAYTRINWENLPSTNTPIDEVNLNKMDAGIEDVDTRLTTVEGEIDTAQTDINNAEAVIGNETDTYSASSTYALGDLVIYNSLLYKCTTAITVAEAWNASKWAQTNLTSLVEKLTNVTLSPYTAYSFDFNGNVYAEKTIDIYGTLTDYSSFKVYIEDNGYVKIMDIDTALLNLPRTFRERIFTQGIQSYCAITKIDSNKINVHLEHTSAVTGSKTINIKIIT